MSRAAITGGDLTIRSLGELGIDANFGVPGVHALPSWEAMRGREARYFGARTELAAAFAADGYARACGEPAALLLSTGPGALISLAGVMEAAASYVPLIAIVSQVETELLGAGRGALHELADQPASFASIVKWIGRADTAAQIPELLAEAYGEATKAPFGPVMLEIPTDLLREPLTTPPPSLDRDAAKAASGLRIPAAESLQRAAELLDRAKTPLIWAGGGVIAGDASAQLRELATRADAPVLTTFMGKGSIPEEDPLFGGAACDEAPFKRILREADVVLCVGSELGEEATSAYSIGTTGKLIRIDADANRAGADGAAVGLPGDAGPTLEALGKLLGPSQREGAERAEDLRCQIEASLRSQGRQRERELLRSIRAALPAGAISCWDMTILGYWAARDFPALAPRRFLYPVGSGTLGYAWPAALGAAIAEPEGPVLAVVGDGGLMYSLAELASARQAQLDATLLVIDDGGYGILREYQRRDGGEPWGVDLVGPDVVELAKSFGVEARATRGESLKQDLEWAIGRGGPTVLVLEEVLRAPGSMP